MSTTKLLQTKEPVHNSSARSIWFLRIGVVFSLKMVDMYWNMWEKLI